jgi:autotransporter-associated beta strand protein
LDLKIPSTGQKRLVIIGGGFGGILAAGTVTVLGTSTYNQLGGGSGLALGLPTTINVPAADGLFVVAGGMRNPASFITGSPASLVKTGSGTLQITGSSSYTGGTQINGGVLALGNAAASGSNGTISFGGGTLQFSSSNNLDYSSRFSGAANQAYRLDTNGQNVSLANSMLQDYLLSKERVSLDKGIQCLDTWLKNARLPNGLFRCHYDYLIGPEDPKNEVQDACNPVAV